MTKQEYIEDRTLYYINNQGLKKKWAKDCAEEDLKLYIEKYGEESLKNR